MIFRVKNAQTKTQIIGCTPTQVHKGIEHAIGTQRKVFTRKAHCLVYTRYIPSIYLSWWATSAVGQSAWLTTQRSRVRFPTSPRRAWRAFFPSHWRFEMKLSPSYIPVLVLELNTFVPVSFPRLSQLPQTWTPCGSIVFWPQTDHWCEVGGAKMPKAKCWYRMRGTRPRRFSTLPT